MMGFVKKANRVMVWSGAIGWVLVVIPFLAFWGWNAWHDHTEAREYRIIEQGAQDSLIENMRHRLQRVEREVTK